jgi:peptidyl-prolyl cis-trans isomerase B (cyclophilin B)
VTSLKDRQKRAAARAKLARDMSERAEKARKRRQRNSIIGATIAVIVVVGAVVGIVTAVTSGGGKKATPAAAASAAPVSCVWKPNPDPSSTAAPNGDISNTGTPPASGEPHAGTRDMTFNTNLGNIVVQLNLAKAPCTSESFTYLAGKKYFDNTSCHRLVNQTTGSAFHVLQCGDPSGTGSGGPAYTFGDENLPTGAKNPYPKGVVAMANSGANTNGSQFFFVFGDTQLSADYTVFGTITSGLDVIQQVAAAGDDEAFASQAGGGHPKKALTFKTVTVGAVQAGASTAPSAGASGQPSTNPSS